MTYYTSHGVLEEIYKGCTLLELERYDNETGTKELYIR